MLETLRRLAVVTAFAILFGSCAKEYTYSPPTTAEGRACVAECQGTQSACRNNEAQNASDA